MNARNARATDCGGRLSRFKELAGDPSAKTTTGTRASSFSVSAGDETPDEVCRECDDDLTERGRRVNDARQDQDGRSFA